MQILKQEEFPLMNDYKRHFPIDENTIFAYDGNIYTNNELPEHLIVHEQEHLKSQEKVGLILWVDQYLTNPRFRLIEEIIAYKAQLNSITNREFRNTIKVEASKHLSSELYGNLCTFEEALSFLS